MTAELNDELPACEVLREDPARPSFARRAKFWGMRTAGQAARLMLLAPRRGCSRDRFGILVYHRVAPILDGFTPPSINVPPPLFREQMMGLKRRGFRFLALQEVLARRARNEALPPLTSVVTFDDGFESVYEYAWPTLRDLGVPATIFVNTRYLDQLAPFPFDPWGQAYSEAVPLVSYRPLTTSQCIEMAATGLVELGAHTHTHADFRHRPQMFRRDMQVCVDHLRDKFGITRPTFAFPYGKPSTGFTDQSLVEVVRDLQLPCALTTEAVCARLSDSPYHWGRFNVYDWDTSDTVAAKLMGYYSWAPRLVEGAIRTWHDRRRLVGRASLAVERGK